MSDPENKPETSAWTVSVHAPRPAPKPVTPTRAEILSLRRSVKRANLAQAHHILRYAIERSKRKALDVALQVEHSKCVKLEQERDDAEARAKTAAGGELASQKLRGDEAERLLSDRTLLLEKARRQHDALADAYRACGERLLKADRERSELGDRVLKLDEGLCASWTERDSWIARQKASSRLIDCLRAELRRLAEGSVPLTRQEVARILALIPIEEAAPDAPVKP